MQKHYAFKELDLYHKDMFIPESLAETLFDLDPNWRYLRLAYTAVARKRAEQDSVPIQDYITVRPDNVVEVGCIPPIGTEQPNLHAIDTVVVREPFSLDRDILLSIAVDFDHGVGTVKMAWTHTPGKPHFSLKDRRGYVQKPKAPFNPAFQRLEVA